MHGSKYFAKIDAKSGFYQLTLAEESRYVTTFITPRGCFRFKRTPFGVSDANEAFQRMMEQILFGIIGVRISIDGVIVHAATMKELVSRLRKVFERCREYNLELNRSKCEFGVSQISVLGHIVSADGIKPDPKKNRCHQGNTSAVKRFRSSIFPWNVWLCCQVHSKLCEYSRATSKTHLKRREVVLGSRSEQGVQRLKGSIIGRGGPRLFPFRCSHLRSYRC